MVASMAIWLGWLWLNPPPPQNPPAKKPAAADKVAKNDPQGDKEAHVDAAPAAGDAAPADDEPVVADADGPQTDEEEEKPPATPAKIPQFPHQIVEIGSDDPDSGYRLAVTIDSRGAAIQSVALNDPRYRSLRDHNALLKVVGNTSGADAEALRKEQLKQDQLVLKVQSIFREHCYKCHAIAKPKGGFRINTREGLLAGGDTGAPVVPGDPERSLIVEAIRQENPHFKMPPKGEKLPAEDINDIVRWIEIGAPMLTPMTLQVTVPQIEDQFAAAIESLNSVNWELVNKAKDKSQAVFRMTSPDGAFELTKTYQVHKIAGDKASDEADAYVVDFDFSIKNLSDAAKSVNYVLQGPVGLPLENVETTQKYRDVQFAYLDQNDKTFHSDSLSAQEIAEGETSLWEQPILKYIGVDAQYFAAFLQPAEEPTAEDSYFRNYTQLATGPVDKDQPERTDISVAITSQDEELQPGETLTHEYELFTGPKRKELLEPRGAEAMMDLGWFGPIAKFMLMLLDVFYAVIPNYGVAIIMLTVLVRLCMFPLSRKQALGAAKMQAIKPEIDALKKKYGDDREKMGRAQMELFRKHNYNPFSGCLVLFIQMPVFFGLYTALRSSVNLRMAHFLWIDNLAAPDALFNLGFNLPFHLGDTFNLLPIITIALFIVQQKLFMPPPTDEQTAMQAKMMQYMMIFMGFMFYSVPAGLCIYFIASSLWGIAERKLLPKVQKSTAAGTDGGGSTGGGGSGGDNSPGTGPKAPPKVGAAKKKSRPRR